MIEKDKKKNQFQKVREENKDKIKLVKEKIQMDKQTFREEGRKEPLENGMMFSNYVSEARLSLKSKLKKKKNTHTQKQKTTDHSHLGNYSPNPK